MLLIKRIIKALLYSVLITPLVAFNAGAATVTFDPLESGKAPNPLLDIGDIFNVNIVGQDFIELAGGTIDLGYDDTIVKILNVSVDPYWDFQPNPGDKDPGSSRWLGIGFDAFVNNPASGNFIIATLQLEAVGGVTSPLTILPSSQFFSATELLSPNTINGTATTVVPLPAALWLMVSALGGLLTLGNRRK